MSGMQMPPEGRKATWWQRFELAVARRLLTLPGPLQVCLSGRPPVVVAGQTLHPQMQLLLALHAWLRPGPLSGRTPREARATLRAEAIGISGRPVEVGAVADLTIETDSGVRAARHYAPLAGGPQPLLVYFHGGGFVAGDIETHDCVCRRICRHAGIHVLSVDYRLAPEHPFPAAVEDAVAAFRWARARAPSLGARPDKVAVGGDSAGGNLAAVVCLKAARDGSPAPCAQILLYPPMDRTTDRPSIALFRDGFLLTREDMDWYQLQYTGTTRAQPIPEQYPLCADDLSGLAPALIVTAGFDPLRDEGEAYAFALRRAGVTAELRRFDGLLHGFCSMAPIAPVCEAAMREICAEISALLDATAGQTAPAKE